MLAVSLERVFVELGNEDRIRILSRLSQSKARLSTMSKDLDIAMPELHRNIARLEDARMIRRENDGMISLTSFGTATLAQLASFRYLAKNADYFTSHSIGELPIRYTQTLGALEDARLVSGISNVIEVFREVIKNAHEYVYVMAAEAPADLTEYTFKSIIEKGLKLRIIMPQDGVVPKRILELKESHKFNALLASKNIERRMLVRISTQIIVNEKESAISFPNLSGRAEYSTIFYGPEQKHHTWCSEYFEHIWINASGWNEEKLRRSL